MSATAPSRYTPPSNTTDGLVPIRQLHYRAQNPLQFEGHRRRKYFRAAGRTEDDRPMQSMAIFSLPMSLYLRQSATQVEKVYQLEKAGGFAGAGSLESRDFTAVRLAAGQVCCAI